MYHKTVRFIKGGMVCLILLNLMSCGSNDDDLVGNWVSRYEIEAGGRTDAVSVSYEDQGYFGTGYNAENTNEYYNDWWQYDPVLNTYTQLEPFEGARRRDAVAFACDKNGSGKIYVGTGYDGTDRLTDFWEYDITNNSWREITSFDGPSRYGAIAFTINNKGYVGTGYGENSTYLKDFYCFDPSTETWSKSTALGGNKRSEAVVFVINNVAYVCTGYNGGYVYDFWKYDGNANPDVVVWEQLRDIYDSDDDESYDDDYDNIIRNNAVAFVSGGKGYVTTGGRGTSGTVTWEYDPSTDLWDEKTGFEGIGRMGAVSFSLGDYGYVLTGNSGSHYFSDIWFFQPDAEQDDNDNGSSAY